MAGVAQELDAPCILKDFMNILNGFLVMYPLVGLYIVILIHIYDPPPKGLFAWWTFVVAYFGYMFCWPYFLRNYLKYQW